MEVSKVYKQKEKEKDVRNVREKEPRVIGTCNSWPKILYYDDKSLKLNLPDFIFLKQMSSPRILEKLWTDSTN